MATKFRLKLARQHGELIAKENGFLDFPIDPLVIAAKEDILVMPKPATSTGVSGGIIFENSGVGIFYSTDIDNDGFKRFTVAHELGHYFLDGHPEEICKTSPSHNSRADFTQGGISIEIEADHFASGLLMPTHLVKKRISNRPVGLSGIEDLKNAANCSLTASAIRAAECSPYPMAIVVSKGNEISYCFMSEGFKALDRQFTFLRKGSPLPHGATRNFNADPNNVLTGHRICEQTTLIEWFGGTRNINIDEEVIGLGSYGYTLSVFSSDELQQDPDEEEDEEARLIESYIPKFAYGR